MAKQRNILSLLIGLFILNTTLAKHYECDVVYQDFNYKHYCRITGMSIHNALDVLTLSIDDGPLSSLWLVKPTIDDLSSKILSKAGFKTKTHLIVQGGEVQKIYVAPTLQLLEATLNGLEELVIPESENIGIVSLYVHKNYLEEVPTNIKYCKQLQRLKLDNNLIQSVNLDVFNGLDKLQEIDLSYNRIHSVDTLAALKLPMLSKLLLKYNRLSNFTFKDLDFPVLANFSIENNALASIDGFDGQFPALEIFEIRRNFWSCKALETMLETMERDQSLIEFQLDDYCSGGSEQGGICCVPEPNWERVLSDKLDKMNRNLDMFFAQQAIIMGLQKNQKCCCCNQKENAQADYTNDENIQYEDSGWPWLYSKNTVV